MKWMKERDLLIAQTMAFVQSVTGKKATAEARQALIEPTPIESTPIESTPVDEIEEPARPVGTLQIEPLQIETLQTESSRTERAQIVRPSPARLNEVRQEIRGRVAAFRAHQELFHRERDEYCNSVLTRVRASTGQAPKTPDHQPSKR